MIAPSMKITPIAVMMADRQEREHREARRGYRGVERNPDGAKYTRIDEYDVRHRHEGRHAGDDLGAEVGVVLG